MLKIILWILLTLISVYLLGDKVRINKNINSFFLLLEDNYSIINERMENTTVMSGLKSLGRLYGKISLICFALVFVFSNNFSHKMHFFVFVNYIFIFSFMGWFSIYWVSNHRAIIDKFKWDNIMIILFPTLLGLFDFFSNSKLTEPFSDFIIQTSNIIGWKIDFYNPIYFGLTFSIIIFFVFVFYYIFTWAIMICGVLPSLVVALTGILLARGISRIDPKNKFYWLAIILWCSVSAYLTFGGL
ncbi:hypothetical protein LOC54_03510 [Acetobacter sp. AN02]|uniref:hypothetical protein n=1 Tax=Acetobacter sp. AN02 TaxID=2894186 RepID=UPI002434380F|nr:hypothetical protein [Acetobacter sp. AN02]MDG6094191.1 hypothetical protein [Acetobacter sp. AN02]